MRVLFLQGKAMSDLMEFDRREFSRLVKQTPEVRSDERSVLGELYVFDRGNRPIPKVVDRSGFQKI